MTRTHRVLEVLGLFTQSQARWTPAEMAGRLGIGRATAYRCIQDLALRGLLESGGGGAYVLGPAIVELDRAIRLNDPLIEAAALVMRSLVDRIGGLAVLCRVHGRKVLCIQTEAGPRTPPSISFERGRAMPLYRGATSRAILSHLSRLQLARLVEEDREALREAGLPADLDTLDARLSAHRGQRYWHTVGEVDSGIAGWAVALRHGNQALGSLSLVMDTTDVAGRDAIIADAVVRAGLRVEGRLSR